MATLVSTIKTNAPTLDSRLKHVVFRILSNYIASKSKNLSGDGKRAKGTNSMLYGMLTEEDWNTILPAVQLADYLVKKSMGVPASFVDLLVSDVFVNVQCLQPHALLNLLFADRFHGLCHGAGGAQVFCQS